MGGVCLAMACIYTANGGGSWIEQNSGISTEASIRYSGSIAKATEMLSMRLCIDPILVYTAPWMAAKPGDRRWQVLKIHLELWGMGSASFRQLDLRLPIPGTQSWRSTSCWSTRSIPRSPGQRPRGGSMKHWMGTTGHCYYRLGQRLTSLFHLRTRISLTLRLYDAQNKLYIAQRRCDNTPL